MLVRGIRGATTIESNTREEIIARTEELLQTLVNRNDIETEDIVSAIFSVTDDISAEFPAVAARRLGWIYTPLMCTREIPVQGSLKMCIRVLLHINTEKKQNEIIHVYLYGAERLRPDLNSGETDRYYTSRK
ncbi:MAG TPA: chorismate mutase [Spirochaetota bacterium]|nr:chorismate mutase [Spirochaetota bacterium]HPI89005.1 chorismate mutase [Spirochaetota bacterium]HPR49287.1 chorismate mutase [Spirochaetota bacterium]